MLQYEWLLWSFRWYGNDVYDENLKRGTNGLVQQQQSDPKYEMGRCHGRIGTEQRRRFGVGGVGGVGGRWP